MSNTCVRTGCTNNATKSNKKLGYVCDECLDEMKADQLKTPRIFSVSHFLLSKKLDMNAPDVDIDKLFIEEESCACIQCHSPNAYLQPDPYQSEINGDDTEYYFCDICIYELAQEI